MKAMKKQYFISIYYLGLIIGAVLMNYILIHHNSFTETLFESFQGLDKLSYINNKELYIYILSKRIKQIFLCGILYFYFSKLITLIVINCYFSFVMGMVISLMVYYKGFSGLVFSAVMFFPVVLLYGIVLFVLWNYFFSERKNSNNISINTILFMFILIIIVSIIEMCVYSGIILPHFGNI